MCMCARVYTRFPKILRGPDKAKIDDVSEILALLVPRRRNPEISKDSALRLQRESLRKRASRSLEFFFPWIFHDTIRCSGIDPHHPHGTQICIRAIGSFLENFTSFG